MQKLQAKFCRSCRLRLLEKSVNYVFSMPLNIPTPPASTSLFWKQRRATTVTDHFLCNLEQTGLIELVVENLGAQRQLILAWEAHHPITESERDVY
jgi:hypothetical protein